MVAAGSRAAVKWWSHGGPAVEAEEAAGCEPRELTETEPDPRRRLGTFACVLGVTLESLVETLPMIAMVLAAEEIDLEAGPEEDRHGEIAYAMDTAGSYAETATQAGKEAGEADEVLAKILATLRALARARAACRAKGSAFRACRDHGKSTY